MLDLSWLTKYFEWRKEILVRGRNYYRKKAVNDVISMSEGNGTAIHARINGTKSYRTTIYFNKNGEYKDSFCSCPYNQGENGEICKHIAALYLHLIDHQMPESLKATAGRDFINELFEIIEAPVNKKNINLEYTIKYNTDLYEIGWEVSFKIGFEKLYVIRNVREFIECIIDGGKLDFGKSFSFNTKIHSLNETDKQIFDFFIQLYNTEMSYKAKYYSGGTSIFNNKGIFLSEELFIKFCSAAKNKYLTFEINKIEYKNIKINFDKYPYHIMIKMDAEKITALLMAEKEYKFLGQKRKILVSDEGVYVLDNNKKSCEFLNIFSKRGINTMEFHNEEKRKLLSLLPQLVGDENISISEEILQNYIRSDLKANLYIDKHKKGIAIKPEFDYGGTKLNPFDLASINPYIIRNYPIENQIIRLIEDSEFKIKEDLIYLDDYDKIYLFFRDMIPVLMELCSIYYTDDVKNVYLGKLKKYKSSILKGFSGNLIDIDFELEGIDKSEVRDILRAIKEKKNYHKLKNGQFLSLEGEESEKLSRLLDKIETNELKSNVIQLSKYRVLGLFENIREQNFFGIENTGEILQIIEKIKNPELQNIDIPEKFKKVLRDYQIAGYQWLCTLSECGFAGILADDMGLGKTVQMISVLYSSLGQGTSIVVAPSSLVYNWESEINKFAPEIKALVISGNKALRQDMINEINTYDLVITSYPLLRRDIELYQDVTFKFCVLDEAQHIKNPDSINSSSVKNLNAQHRFALTGTPMENSLSELWSIFDFLMPGYLLSRTSFSNKFEKSIQRDGDKEALAELRKMIAPFILRRKKKDVLKELPDKIETKLLCELTEEQRKLYTAYAALAKEEISKKIEQQGFEKNRIQILSMITRLRQICCHPSVFMENYTGSSGKMELLEELIDELIEGEHRILLFSQFTSLLEIIRNRLEEKNVKYLYLDGSIPSFKRKTLVDSFNSGQGSIFLISLKAGGTGLNLTSADCVIHFDPWWNPAVEDQASDRAHRIGQENVVEVFKLITKDTIEEKIFALQNRKKELINSVIMEGETFLNKLSENEIMDLFKIEE